jgi:hypothetical protein
MCVPRECCSPQRLLPAMRSVREPMFWTEARLVTQDMSSTIGFWRMESTGAQAAMIRV